MNEYKPTLLTLLFCALLSVVFSCKKTDNDLIMAPSLNCSVTTLSTTTFVNNGQPQNSTLTVGLKNAISGKVTFNITSSGTGFKAVSYTADIATEQKLVDIPITFSGTSNVTSETLTIQAASYTPDACNVVATISNTPINNDCANASNTTAKVVCATETFLATLTTTQKAAVVLEYSKANATKWSEKRCDNCRNGLRLADLTATQVTAALAIIKAATGTTTNDGYDEIQQIRTADDVLKSAGQTAAASGNYFIAFVGTPSLSNTWQLQFSGYNVAINYTYKADATLGATPLFTAIEPTSWTNTSGTVFAPQNDERDALNKLLTSFSNDQQNSAKTNDTFSDVLLGSGKDGAFPTNKTGIKVSSLSTEQQTLVLNAFKHWVFDTDETTANRLLTTYQNELADTYITFSGNTSLTNNGDYIRIDGPSVWIEFICLKGSVLTNQMQYRSVWRDRSRDYGGSFSF